VDRFLKPHPRITRKKSKKRKKKPQIIVEIRETNWRNTMADDITDKFIDALEKLVTTSTQMQGIKKD